MIMRILMFMILIKLLSSSHLIHPIVSAHDFLWNNVRTFIEELTEAES